MASYSDLDTKYDDDFRSGLVKIKPFILDLQKQENVFLCRMWLEKLIKSEPSERALRNVYLEELCKHVKNNDLDAPFNTSPAEGALQPINPSSENRICNEKSSDQETVELIETSLCTDETNVDCQKDEPVTEEGAQSTDSEEECCAEQYCSSESLDSVPCVNTRVDSNTSYESVQEQLQTEVEEKPISSSKTSSNESLIKGELLQLKNENNSLKEEIKDKNNTIHDLEIERGSLNEKILVLNKNLENVNVELKQLQDFEKGFLQARKDVELWIGKYKILDARSSEMENSYLKKIEDYENSTRHLKTEIEKLRLNEEKITKPFEDQQLELELSNKKIEALEKERSVLIKMNEKLEKNIKEMTEKYEEKVNTQYKEIAQLKNRLQEECDRMKTEIKSMRDTSVKDNDEVKLQLKTEISDYKLKLANLTNEMNEKIRQYEAKIDTIKKTTEMELCMQKMTLISDFSVARQKELENIISVLDQKYQARLIETEAFKSESKGNQEINQEVLQLKIELDEDFKQESQLEPNIPI
ncbi:hypothetical protein LSTR_LSTR005378 [Laodelphax striatellus]|uniref:DUF4485 domain-containing protein n=1 Tax=Laodelphax striatellus TaxID=195883 RepID=A0A482WQU2_LAOST|nr:hypothetical protein LSTR_LSTR005378 [Laodelphax striatellus]